MSSRFYEFSWDLIGNVEKGRQLLGPETRLEVYRLFQYTLRDILEQRLQSKEEVDKIFYEAGITAGQHFAQKFVGKQNSLYAFLNILQKQLQDFKIGILRVEDFSPQNAKLVIAVEEDLDCSGLPDVEEETCHYDEGFLKGALDFQTGENYNVKEVDCWCLGGRTCRFEAQKTN